MSNARVLRLAAALLVAAIIVVVGALYINRSGDDGAKRGHEIGKCVADKIADEHLSSAAAESACS